MFRAEPPFGIEELFNVDVNVSTQEIPIVVLGKLA
jgi:hypothetical protein